MIPQPGLSYCNKHLVICLNEVLDVGYIYIYIYIYIYRDCSRNQSLHVEPYLQ